MSERGALDSLGIWLDRLGRHQDALTASTEAVTLHRTLAGTNPDAHHPDLATALINLGIRLDDLDRHREALDVRAEAVRLYRDLADRDRDLYQAEYHRRDAALRREYALLGMERQAMAPDSGQPASSAVPPATEEAG